LSNEQQPGLVVEGVNKRFGEVTALADVHLHVSPGEFFTLLGPSGCGKTTLLRIIAGLEMADKGAVYLAGRDISRLPATKRQVNTVFQSYALFPHLSIFENVAFGLKSRKFPKDEVEKRVYRRLDMLGLKDMADRRPAQLSGGQQQRVALARALVNEPDVLLLDEPMSALDAKLRAQLQVELRRLQRKLNQTFILVTHDQAEALVCSDRIAVMQNGRIIQFGTPEEVYDEPRNKFVAEFLGAANLIEATAVKGGAETELGFLQVDKELPWSRGRLAIRPEWIRIRDQQPPVNGLLVTVKEVIYRGTDLDIWVDPGPLRVRSNTYRRVNVGDQVWLELAPGELVVLNE
jgi:spermidine/putrescine transport system ATP-binding protein